MEMRNVSMNEEVYHNLFTKGIPELGIKAVFDQKDIQPEDVEAEFGEDDEDVVADAGNNADLYAANQASTELINEVPTEEAPLRFMDQDVFHHQPLSLD